MKAFKSIALAAVAVTVMAFGMGATAFASFYPADRQTYTCTTPTNCRGADHVQFNSFTNNPVVGDERPFFAGSIGGANVADRIKVNDGDTIVLRAYVHNNADPNLIGTAAAIARNVNINVLIPTAKQSDTNMVAFIKASNANPGTINDTMSVYGDAPFTIEYVAGSAKWSTNSGTVALSDNIVTPAGTYLGDMNGCFGYSGYVTLTVKIKMDAKPVTPVYSCDVMNLSVIGERKVSANVKYTATNGATFNNVSFDFGDGSQKVVTTNTTATHTYATDGTYTVRATPSFTVDGKVVTADSAACAKVITFKGGTPVEPPKNTPSTGPTATIGLFAAVSAISAIGYRLWMIRRLGN